jgi:hypothetical protein
MIQTLFNTNKGKAKARLQVGLIEDSDDDDFLEPLVFKKKSRKLSGNDLLTITSQKSLIISQQEDINPVLHRETDRTAEEVKDDCCDEARSMISNTNIRSCSPNEKASSIPMTGT